MMHLNYITSTFLQSTPASGAPAPSPMMGLLPMYALIFMVVYFLILRPQKQKQKSHEDMIANVAKHDEIVTAGGIHGTIVALKDSTVVIRVDDKVRVEIDRSAIARITKSKNIEENNG